MKLKYNDQWHSYWLDGKRCKGVTTVAKIPDDTYRLELWGKRQVAIGLASSPALVEAVAAHFDDDKKVNDICAEASEAAKASSGATRGTAAHRITERHDLGEPILDTPLAAYVVASWKAALEAADLEVLPEYIERAVVFPDRLIAGRFDRILRRRSDGRLFIGDVKGGQRAIQYPHAIAVQLGLYANAPLIAAPVGSGNWEVEAFEPMPDVDKEIAFIFHLPESGEAAVATVDIAGGWDITTRAIFPIIDWRARGDLCATVHSVGGGEPAPAPPTAVEQAPPADPSRRQAVIERIKVLPEVERAELAHRWPVGVPTFKQSEEHTDEQLDAIERLVDAVDWSPVTDDRGPTCNAVAARTADPTLHNDPVWWQPPDEGAQLDADTVDAIKAMIADLDKSLLAQVNQWAQEAHAAKRPFSLSREGDRTERRFEIMRATIALSPYEPEVARAALGFVMGEEVQPAVSIGAAFGSLTIEEARRLARMAELIGSRIAVVYDKSGIKFVGDGLEMVAA